MLGDPLGQHLGCSTNIGLGATSTWNLIHNMTSLSQRDWIFQATEVITHFLTCRECWGHICIPRDELPHLLGHPPDVRHRFVCPRLISASGSSIPRRN
uniref:Uncharacterized protein n=1 Tax=Lutzomyia longipalpis TaxID=7200 RepID=A0A1B0EXZ1_LUTLO